MKLKYWFCLVLIALNTAIVNAQVIRQNITPQSGQIFFTNDIAIPKEDVGYTLVLPDSETADGLIVQFHSNWDTDGSNEAYAIDPGLGVMYLSTGNRLDFFFEEEAMQQVENYMREVIEMYDIPAESLLFYGQSIGGTRAIKQAIFSKTQNSQYKLTPIAVAMADSPLDFIRLWNQEIKALRDKASSISVNEAQWVTAYLKDNLGGTPSEKPDAYISYSPYCHSAKGGRYLDELSDLAIRAYHEPDVIWWMQNRGKSYYEMNVMDGAGLINELRMMGNKKAELILTEDKGYYPDGTRHPHSGSIVDKDELAEWFLRLIN